MKALRSILAIIISCQLLISCQGGGEGAPLLRAGPTDPAPSRIFIEGTISFLSSSLISSAHAADGTLVVSDYTDPTSPVELTKMNIQDTDTFSIELEREKVVGKLLKLHFESHDPSKSRHFLIVPDGTQKKVSTDLSSNTTTQALVMEMMITRKINNGEINPLESIETFHENSSLDLSEWKEMLGDENFLTLLTNKEYVTTIADILVELIYAKNNEDQTATSDLIRKISEVGAAVGIKFNILLGCSGNSGMVNIMNGSYAMTARALHKKLLERYRSAIYMGTAETSEQGNYLLSEIAGKIATASKELDSNLSMEITFSSDTEEAKCILSGFPGDRAPFDDPNELAADFTELQAPIVVDSPSYHLKVKMNDFFKLIDGFAMTQDERKKLFEREFQLGLHYLWKNAEVPLSPVDFGSVATFTEAEKLIYDNLESWVSEQPEYAKIHQSLQLEIGSWYFDMHSAIR